MSAPAAHLIKRRLTVTVDPDNNCAATGKIIGRVETPQSVFQNYLNHTGATFFINGFANATAAARQANIPLMMFETNTASCGGFPGVSDSFGAALWSVIRACLHRFWT